MTSFKKSNSLDRVTSKFKIDKLLKALLRLINLIYLIVKMFKELVIL
jgi:hypothetical protein